MRFSNKTIETKKKDLKLETEVYKEEEDAESIEEDQYTPIGSGTEGKPSPRETL